MVLVLRTEWAASEICRRGEAVIWKILGEPLHFESCAIDPLRARFVATGIRFGGETADSPLLTAQRILIELSPLALAHKVGIRSIELDEPELRWSVPPATGEEGSEGGDCLGIFERLQVDSLILRGARAEVALDGGASTYRVGRLDAALERRQSGLLPSLGRRTEGRKESYLASLELEGGRFEEEGRSIALDSLATTMALHPDTGLLELQRLEAKAGASTLGVKGEILDLCHPRLELSVDLEAALGELGPLAGMDELEGTLQVEGRISGPAEAPTAVATVGFVGLGLHGYAFGEMLAHVSYMDRRLDIDELIWPIGDGRARIKAQIAMEGDWPMEAEVRTEGLEFHRLLTRLRVQNTPVIMTVDSTHQLTGHLAGGFLLEGQSALELRGFRVRNAPWHVRTAATMVEIPGVARLDTRVRITEDDIFLDGARLDFGGGSHLDIDARLGLEERRGLHIDAKATHLDLAHVASHVAGLPFSGAGVLDARIDGPYPDPIIEGQIEMEGVRFYGAELGRLRSNVLSHPGRQTLDFHEVAGTVGTSTYDAEVALLLGSEPTIEAKASVREGGRLGDLFQATLELVPPFEWLREHLEGRVREVRGVVKGRLPDVSMDIEVDATAIRFLERPFDTLRASVHLPDFSAARIEDLVITRGEGSADGHLHFEFPKGRAAVVRGGLEARRLPLRDLFGGFGEWAEIEGDAGARLQFVGPTDGLDISGEIFGDYLAAKEVDLGSTRLSVETQAEHVILRGALAHAGLLSASIRLANGLPFDASFDLDVADLSRFLPPSLELGGVARGNLRATGRLSDLEASQGSIALSSLGLRSGDFRVESEGVTRLRFAGSSFVLERLALRGPNTELSLLGERDAGGVWDMEAKGAFDARLVEKALPQIEYAGGVIEIQASLTGRSERPILVGSARLRDGTFRVKALPIQVQGLQTTVAFSQNQVVLEDSRLVVNGGDATLRGTVSLGDWAPDQFDLILDGSGIRWRKPEDWPAVVSGRVSITGAWPSELLLGGELRVDRLRYTKDLELEKAMLDFRKRVQTLSVSNEEERIHFDLDLVGGDDMRVDNNLIRARLQFVASPGAQRGRLKLVGNNVRLGLLGSVEVLDATAFFRGNEYRITHGMVDFSDRDRIDPSFDLTAETEVRDYRVGAHAYGKLGDGGVSGYQLDLRSEPTLAQADIVTLLTFGITSWDLDRGGNAALGAGVAAEALLAVSGLDEHLRRWLPQTNLFMDPDLSVTSQYSELTGQMEPMAVFEARVLTEGLKLKAAAPFSTSKGRRVSAEYKVNEALSTQLVWQNEVVGYSSGDLGVDLKLRWEWE